MTSPAVMQLAMDVEAATWPLAAQTVIAKMGAVCPAMPFEVTRIACKPAPTSTGAPRDVGPPWRFTVAVQLITLI